MAIVPHKGNNFRPHLIRRQGLAIVLALALIIQLGFNVATTGTILGDKSNITIAALAEDTNRARRENGLADLQVNNALNRAAYLKAQDMFAKQYWAHDAPDGTSPWKFFADAGYNYGSAGENLAKNFRTAEAVTAAWLASDEHRQNLLDPDYRDVGFAVVSGNLDSRPATIVVAHYGQPAEQTAAAASFKAPSRQGTLAPLSQFAVGFQAMTPALAAALALLSFTAGVALMAHVARYKLPKKLRQTWYRHHGVIKAGGLTAVMLMMVWVYGGGQI